MSQELFLIDSNSFIEPYNRYYSFDLAENFWEQIKNNIENGSIVILDMVKDEINRGNDQLSDWMREIRIAEEIDHRAQNIILNYRNVLDYIQNEPSYKETALENWSQEHIADAWLIATAIAKDYTIITFEQKKRSINPGNKYKNAKIPDVAEHFNVKVDDLFYLMRTLNIKL